MPKAWDDEVPDAAPSSSPIGNLAATPDTALSAARDMDTDDDDDDDDDEHSSLKSNEQQPSGRAKSTAKSSKGTKRNKVSAAYQALQNTRPPSKRARFASQRAVEAADTPYDDDGDDSFNRKLPARKKTARSRFSTRKEPQQQEQQQEEDTTPAAKPLTEGDLRGISPEPRFVAMAGQRKFSKGTDTWNARLMASSGGKAANVSALEILQQAQGRLVLPPVRFPPRESHLHSIFQPSGGGTTTTPPVSSASSTEKSKAARSLEECYRDLLRQEVEEEEELRTEYQSFRKTAFQDRMSRILTLESRLKKQEQTLLAKLEGWAAP